jgi:hypothetical protein
MLSRGILCGVMSLLVAAAASAEPTSINDLAPMARLDAQQQARVREYAEYWSKQLSADPGSTAAARLKLLAPLQHLQVTEFFRTTYANALVPEPLASAVTGDKPYAAYSAMHVAGFLGTDKALELILAHCDAQQEQRVGVRLWAAKAFAILVAQRAVQPNDLNNGLRRLQDAAEREGDWLVLRRQFEAVASADNSVARDVQSELLKTTSRRMAQTSGPSELMQATDQAVRLARTSLTTLPSDDQQRFGAELGPAVEEVLKVADAHWERAQADPEYSVIYGRVIEQCEALLSYIDSVVRKAGAGSQPPPPPHAQLSGSWRSGNRRSFKDVHALWQGILDRPPYRQP